ncbi:hypothetical protein V8F06_007718 [Rhypophila decipiens]
MPALRPVTPLFRVIGLQALSAYGLFGSSGIVYVHGFKALVERSTRQRKQGSTMDPSSASQATNEEGEKTTAPRVESQDAKNKIRPFCWPSSVPRKYKGGSGRSRHHVLYVHCWHCSSLQPCERPAIKGYLTVPKSADLPASTARIALAAAPQ